MYFVLNSHLLNTNQKFFQLWSPSGPRDTIKPKGFLVRLKWRLILYWNTTNKTILAGKPSGDVDYDELGTWSRCKRILTRRWTSQIRETEDIELHGSFDMRSSMGEITALPGKGEIQPSGGAKPAVPQPPWAKRLSTSSDPIDTGRPSSKGSSAGRNSGVMVEEERPNWLQELASKGLHVSDRMGASTTLKESKGEGKRPSSLPSPLKDSDVPEISIEK